MLNSPDAQALSHVWQTDKAKAPWPQEEILLHRVPSNGLPDKETLPEYH